ncbi:putative ripening-related protein 1 [Carica papaya]|uniref:putative ripening-related protein 1 n=1 Tax=Carica papaya TaxID=3649 RepID=UPI000B8CB399|nr:putative ripening-related protein 1 [Carica papaya]
MLTQKILLLDVNKSFVMNLEKYRLRKLSPCLRVFFVLCFFLIASHYLNVEAQKDKPNGKLRGKKPPPGKCDQGNESKCCKERKFYTTYKCSPPVIASTKATLIINNFEEGHDGGGPSECDNNYHLDKEPMVALSTGWYNKRSRCLKYINIHGNGRTVKVKVVDECNSTMGCDDEHDYQPVCSNNIVDASKAVWKALGVPESTNKWGQTDIYWSDA